MRGAHTGSLTLSKRKSLQYTRDKHTYSHPPTQAQHPYTWTHGDLCHGSQTLTEPSMLSTRGWGLAHTHNRFPGTQEHAAATLPGHWGSLRCPRGHTHTSSRDRQIRIHTFRHLGTPSYRRHSWKDTRTQSPRVPWDTPTDSWSHRGDSVAETLGDIQSRSPTQS